MSKQSLLRGFLKLGFERESEIRREGIKDKDEEFEQGIESKDLMR